MSHVKGDGNSQIKAIYSNTKNCRCTEKFSNNQTIYSNKKMCFFNQIITNEALKIYRCVGLTFEHSDSTVWGGAEEPFFFLKFDW